jgi:hypothetical protein
MSSFFHNYGRHLYDGSVITSGYSGVDREPRCPETGRLLRHLTKAELDGVYARFPHLREHGVEPFDPNYRRPLDDCHTVGGTPASLERKYHQISNSAALLRDPVTATRRAEPTKPAKPEGSLFRTALNEIGHLHACFGLNIRVQAVTVKPNGSMLGEVVVEPGQDHDFNRLCVLAAGAVAEEIVCGDSVTGHTDNLIMREIANDIAEDGEFATQELIDEAYAVARLAMDGQKKFLTKAAFELIRRKRVDGQDEIKQMLAECAKAVASKGRDDIVTR